MLQRLTRWFDLLATLAMIAASGAVIYAVVGAKRQSPPVPGQPTKAAAVETLTNQDAMDLSSNAAIAGSKTSRIALVEFTDFQCPYCGRFARDTFPQIRDEFVKTGKVLYVLHNFPLVSIHAQALGAASAADCAGDQGHFWEMHDRLFADQKGLDEPGLKKSAGAIGLVMPEFEKCVGGAVREKIMSDESLGKQLGVNSTPTFLIGEVQRDGKVKPIRRLKGAQEYPAFKAALDEVLRSAN